MANFSQKEASECIILDAEARYEYKKAKSGEGSFTFAGVGVHVMDRQGNVYNVSLTPKEIPEATYAGESAMKAILMAVYTVLTKTAKETKSDKNQTEAFSVPLQGLIGRRADDFK